MKQYLGWVSTAALTLAACGGDDSGTLDSGVTSGGAGNLSTTGAVATGTGASTTATGGFTTSTGGFTTSTGASTTATGDATTSGVGTTATTGTWMDGGSATGGDASSASTTGTSGDPVMATEPIIPEIEGECPSFTDGTKTVMGVGGIQFAVGSGTGGPLAFYWHGTGGRASARSFPGYSEILAMGGVVVSFGPSSGEGTDCSGTRQFSHGDFEVVDQIVACAVREHGVDPKRIYASGCSAGGLYTGCMSIMRSQYVAAVVPNSGGVTIGVGALQDETRVPASLTMHGAPGRDVVIIDFSDSSAVYNNRMLSHGSAMVINCDHGGGHCGAPSALQSSAWEFMKAHPFGTRPSPYEGGLPAGFHDSCEIWEMTDQTGPGGAGFGGFGPP